MRLQCQTCKGLAEVHSEVVPASKYYGSHATGHVLLVNGYPHLHAPLKELKQSRYYPAPT